MKSASLPFKKNDKEVKGDKRNKRKESKSQCRQKPTKGKSSTTPLFNVLTPKAPSPHVPGISLVPAPIITAPGTSKASGNATFTSVTPAAAAQTLAATLASNATPAAAQPPSKEKKTEGETNFLADRKEYKGTRRDKQQPARTTIRKKKGSNTSTNTTTSDGKSSSEQDGKQRSKTDKRKESHSSDSKKSGSVDKSSGSKEPSDSEETKEKKTKKLRELSMKLRRRSGDFRLERMPDSSQLNLSVKALRKKIKVKKTEAVEENLFKTTGEPVWVVPERSIEECEKTEDGEAILNPELTAAMAELGIELDETVWLEKCGSYMSGSLEKGTRLPNGFEFNEFAPFDVLAENSIYISREAVIHGTAHNLVVLVEGDPLKRYGEVTEEGGERRRRPGKEKSTESDLNPPATQPSNTSANSSEVDIKSEHEQLNAPQQGIKFDMMSKVHFTYDRYHPIASIRKFVKMKSRSISVEQTTQEKSKENS